MVRRKLTAAVVAAVICLSAQATPLPQYGTNAHEGVASCSNSVCHGKVSPDPSSPVLLNEYRTWLREGYHSRAYKSLMTPQAQTMARKLGLESAHTAKICLDCHADNVAPARRGRRFNISDGVSCEACHGGAGRWLESHAEAGTSHTDNLDKGMYPTEQPLERARLCLSCHLGTVEKFATHTIMGAGHPRLAFDLEVFTENQPRHYRVDEDYRRRKPYIPSVNMWLAGLVISSAKTLELLQSERFTRPALVPELSFYQCHACHHPMDNLRWRPEGGANALPPGAVRLNDASLSVLQVVLDSLAREEAANLRQGIAELHDASMRNREAVTAQAANLQRTIGSLQDSLIDAAYDERQVRALRAGLVKAAADERFRHFTTAEQAFLAVETLNIALGDGDRLSDEMDAWFATVQDENDFQPLQFALFARKVRAKL